MNKNDENLEGLVKKLQQQGIAEGNAEKKKIITAANNEAEEIIAKANTKAEQIVAKAKEEAEQLEKNGNAALKQAFRDLIGATEVASLKFLKSVFGTQCQKTFAETEYLKILVDAAVSQIKGNKTLQISADKVEDMQNYLVAQGLSDTIKLKPLPQKESRIVINCDENKGVSFTLESDDIENALFELLNPELVKRIKNQED